jgi:hypothetical protein
VLVLCLRTGLCSAVSDGTGLCGAVTDDSLCTGAVFEDRRLCKSCCESP